MHPSHDPHEQPEGRPDEGGPRASGRRQNTTVRPDDPSTWPEEIGGQSGPEPTRYGDWEKNGRCTDF